MVSPIVSIITPVHNLESYIERCIKSVINQTFKEWEYILIDDGSTDNSLAIMESYAKNYPQITVQHSAGGGISS